MPTTPTTLINTWTIRVEAKATNIATSHFLKGNKVEITQHHLKVIDPNIQPPATTLEVSGGSFQMAPDQMRAEFVFLSTSGNVITGVVQCTSGDPVSSIVGLTTKGDPEDVAVWGGDDG